MITENQKITDGNATFIVRKMGGVLRIGFISMFDGTFDNDGHPIDATTGLPDDHWHICDGTNGTPDLRDRFIVGSGNAYAVGNTGGEATHALTESEMPAHRHYPDNNGAIAGNFICTFLQGTDHWLVHGLSGGQAWNPSIMGDVPMSSAGGNQPHENRPPYYALAFIKKIK